MIKYSTQITVTPIKAYTIGLRLVFYYKQEVRLPVVNWNVEIGFKKKKQFLVTEKQLHDKEGSILNTIIFTTN